MRGGLIALLLSLLQLTNALRLPAAAAARPLRTRTTGPLRMQADGPAGFDEGVELVSSTDNASAEKPPAPTGMQTFYDDEAGMPDIPAKPAVSDAMRQCLLNEQRGLGADANSSNPFLLVFGGVGIFVVLGAIAVNI